MGHLERELVTYGSAWVAMVALVAATVYMLWLKRRDRRQLFTNGSVLHAHPDVIHAHRDGDAAHVHAANGQQVLIRQ
jgi:hypothetical protein